MLYIIMGVSGSGKSTVGLKLAERLQLPFFDADDYHPETNLAKMSNMVPLTDTDRSVWLMQLHLLLKQAVHSKGLVMACSALKETYRQVLQEGIETKVQWIFLHGDPDVLQQRLKMRKGHFMPAELLQSQLDILEEPDYGLHIDITFSPDEIVDEIVKKLNII